VLYGSTALHGQPATRAGLCGSARGPLLTGLIVYILKVILDLATFLHFAKSSLKI